MKFRVSITFEETEFDFHQIKFIAQKLKRECQHQQSRDNQPLKQNNKNFSITL